MDSVFQVSADGGAVKAGVPCLPMLESTEPLERAHPHGAIGELTGIIGRRHWSGLRISKYLQEFEMFSRDAAALGRENLSDIHQNCRPPDPHEHPIP
jgi:hypothetical protein